MKWIPIPGFPRYQASGAGGIRNAKTGDELVGCINPDGYLSTTVRVDGAPRTVRLHSLVAAAFHGECPPGHCVDHINRVRIDNRAANLRYLPWSKNSAQGGRPGVPKPPGMGAKISEAMRGSKHPGALLKEDDVKEIRLHKNGGMSVHIIAAAYGITARSVYAVCSRQTWRHVK